MSEIKNIFDIAARGMSAQMVRLNTVASNLANARSVASSDAEAYKAIKAVFKTVYADDIQKSSGRRRAAPRRGRRGPRRARARARPPDAQRRRL